MTILPNSIVVASEEFFSFMVHEAELLEALAMAVVPDDFPNESLRGLPIIEVKVTARKPAKERDGVPAVRVMFKHPVNPRSQVILQRQARRRRPEQAAEARG